MLPFFLAIFIPEGMNNQNTNTITAKIYINLVGLWDKNA